MRSAAVTYLRRGLGTVPGWLTVVDAAILLAVADSQASAGTRGDLLEIGAYEGASAILLGYLRCPGERLLVCDLFAQPADGAESRAEQSRYYAGLTRQRFEANYRRFHAELPEVIEAPSVSLSSLGLGPVFRLVHVDGSHAYEDVRTDLASSRQLLAPGGVLAIDDISAGHVPGVAAAVWEAVANDGLVPFAMGAKLYATWGGEPPPVELEEIAAELGRVFARFDHVVAGHRLACYEDQTTPSGPGNFALAWLPPRAVEYAQTLLRRSRRG